METIIDKMKPLQILYNYTILKIRSLIKKSKNEKSLEEQIFELEQELDIPSHLRWHNKDK